MAIQIRNGTVYDPANGIEGEKRDIFVDDGKIVDEIKPDEIIDATNKTVMAGGIDVHSHVATYGLGVYACERAVNDLEYRELRASRTQQYTPGGHISTPCSKLV
jgi:formylmethanofuran dehydrogenase subunit A